MAVVEHRGRVMGSELHLIVVDPPGPAQRTLDDAVAELDRLERHWSRFLADSDLSRLNRAEGRPVAVDRCTMVLLATMAEAWRMTAGRFEPAVLPDLVAIGYDASLHDPNRRTALPPSARSARPGAPLAPVAIGDGGWPAALQLDEAVGSARLPQGVALDAGGIGKGLAADLVVRRLLDAGCGGVLVGIGGDLSVGGAAPSAGGWTIVVEDPFLAPGPPGLPGLPGRPNGSDGSAIALLVDGGGVATSSTRSRRWVQAGAARHHQIDPVTGLPSDTDLAAVTVIAPTGWQAEAHATAALSLGRVGALDHLRGHGLTGLAFPAGGGAPLATEDLAAALGLDPSAAGPCRPPSARYGS